MFKFITHRPFWVNLLAAILLAFVLMYLFLKTLGFITKHGEYLTVPSVTGKNTEEAIKFLESKGFDVQIQDSVYTDTTKNGIVLKQLPEGNSTVKVNRTVFLTVNRLIPPMIDMPKLEDMSLSFALDMLDRNHLKLGDTIFKPSFMKGAVIEQQYNGSKILPGAKVRWGSKITLVVGEGTGNEKMPIPELVGMTYGEAKSELESMGILPIPVPYPPGTALRDTNAAYVIKQGQEPFNELHQPQYIQSGQVMDLFISSSNENPFDTTNKPNPGSTITKKPVTKPKKDPF
ncbi:MAG: PASTA domain-containing protein [Ferruginibacter sp.]